MPKNDGRDAEGKGSDGGTEDEGREEGWRKGRDAEEKKPIGESAGGGEKVAGGDGSRMGKSSAVGPSSAQCQSPSDTCNSCTPFPTRANCDFGAICGRTYKSDLWPQSALILRVLQTIELDARREPIFAPFLAKDSEEEFEQSLLMFKLVLCYQFESDDENILDLAILAKAIIRLAFLHRSLRDELFLQLLNQTHNSLDKTASDRAWTLLLCALNSFGPSELVFPLLYRQAPFSSRSESGTNLAVPRSSRPLPPPFFSRSVSSKNSPHPSPVCSSIRSSDPHHPSPIEPLALPFWSTMPLSTDELAPFLYVLQTEKRRRWSWKG